MFARPLNCIDENDNTPSTAGCSWYTPATHYLHTIKISASDSNALIDWTKVSAMTESPIQFGLYIPILTLISLNGINQSR